MSQSSQSTSSSSSSNNNAGSPSGTTGKSSGPYLTDYTIKTESVNTEGNYYQARDYNPRGVNQNTYYYSNNDGSYYYSNPNGSTYYNDGQGGSKYTRWPQGRGGQ